MSDDLNSFIRNRVTAKSNDFKSLFGNVKHSRPYINIGMHFDLSNSKVISSEAALPTLPNIALAEREKDFCVVHGASKLSTLYNVRAQIANFVGPW